MENSILIEEIRELFEYYNNGNMILDIIYNIVTTMMLIVSMVNMFIAWKVYHQSEIMHKENMNFNKKMHADSLTPYIVIKTSRDYVLFKSDRFTEMKIENVDVSDKLYLNNIAEIDINELKAEIYAEFVLFNMSDLPAELELEFECLGSNRIVKERLVGKEEKIIKFETCITPLDKDNIIDIINNCKKLMFTFKYTGPGMSARDSIFGQIELFYDSKGNINEAFIEQLKRERNYD